MRTTIVRTEIQVLARDAGLHPDLVRRLIRLGAVEPGDAGAAARLAQIIRLRNDLGLNYAGAILVSDLLARIERLEARNRWTPTG
jgi:chaperone modulatory protein CbpM